MKIALSEIDCFVYDFDGVLTDNKVYVNEEGTEMVACNRSDGLAISKFRELNKKQFILSTEKNGVVTQRARKLKLDVIQGVDDKPSKIREIAKNHSLDMSKILYIGNDLNDLEAMLLCGFKLCPSDAYSEILEISDMVLESKGGYGVVRELYSHLMTNEN